MSAVSEKAEAAFQSMDARVSKGPETPNDSLRDVYAAQMHQEAKKNNTYIIR